MSQPSPVEQTIAERIRDAIARGDRAATTLNNPGFMDAINAQRQELRDQWERCQAPGIREAIWHRLNGLNSAMGQLELEKREGLSARAEQKARNDAENDAAERRAAGKRPIRSR